MADNDLPFMVRVQQQFEGPTCDDIRATVHAQLASAGADRQVHAGQTVAITAGSRGIARIAEIIKAIAEFFTQHGARPFIVPAMGSHGGGTAAGQRRVLESYGITENFCRCPIRASMETVVIGQAREGFPIYFDKQAHSADHVVVCGRIKPHTNFIGDIQSGLMKMMMIGLGKKDGAALYHRAIHDYGFPQIIRSVAPKVCEHANILVGVAVVENAMHQAAHIEAIAPDDFQGRETELLSMARKWMPKLPFEEIDILVIDEIGKNISGTGMDTNVIGRKPGEDIPGQPRVKRVIVRGLTPQSHGNAAGIGFAEFCLTRVIEQMDGEATVLNCLTALDVSGAKIPVHYPTDAEVLRAASQTLGMKQPHEARLVWIQNSSCLDRLVCSTTLSAEIRDVATLQSLGEPEPIPFEKGMLPSFLEFNA